MKRRQFLRTGLGASALGLGGFSGLSFATSSSNRRLLTIYNQGGWDTPLLFDSHPDSQWIEVPDDLGEDQFGGITIATSPERTVVSEFFQQHSDKLCIVNGVAVGSISHTKCEKMFFTGSRKVDAPDYASIVAHNHSGTRPLPYVILSGPRITGQFGSIVTNVDSTFSDIIQERDVLHQIPHDKISEFLFSQTQDSTETLVQEYQASLERRAELNNWRNLFNLTGELTTEEQFQMVSELFSEDIAQSVLVKIKPPVFHYWDTHSGNDQVQSGCYNYLFEKLGHLMEILEGTTDNNGNRLIDTTMVLVISEMGRMPVYNLSQGKDHWPYTSMMLFGDGIRGGTVVGKTDDKLGGKAVSMSTGEASENGTILTSENVVAGLLHCFDVDPEEYLGDVEPFFACFSD